MTALPATVSAEENPVINTSYSYVDKDVCNVFNYPSLDRISHMGLSKGEVAYSKTDNDPFVYIWNSTTGETKTFDTAVIAEEKKKDDWISFWMDIDCLDISNGVIYYSLATHTTTPNGTAAITEGLFSFDGTDNLKIISRHYILDIRADNDLVLIRDLSWYDWEEFTDLHRLRIYSKDDKKITTIYDKSTDNALGFEDYNIAVAAMSLDYDLPNVRIPEDGITVFRLSPNFTEESVKSVTIPSSTNYSYLEGNMGINQDCFSGDILIWPKYIRGSDEYGQSTLYATDINTLEDTYIDEKQGTFEAYSYAVDGNYLVYKNDGQIFLYHIPDGNKKEIIVSGNDEFEVGDIVEFDEGQLLVRAYPKEYTGYNPSKYEIWFIDLNSYINPVEESETGTIAQDNKGNAEKRQSPILLILPIFAIFVVCSIFVKSFKKN
ncbi:hypothetical protein L1994_00570 [Methanomicrobium antiquum]|uniref:Uncharacterized protein n=1 Tax=Methanomicrobium antiquum TaxID=487686 RepID=A0AAF0JMU5_9EURY|nr:hypothetical protein [Methanomicrobium antiquum]WFN36925.1 hypothetical protein L1994_00570 [Methanomicrobium antiquum]